MISSILFTNLFESSKLEQLKIVVYFKGCSLKGIVTNILDEAVELRTTEGKRSIILLNSIDAVVLD